MIFSVALANTSSLINKKKQKQKKVYENKINSINARGDF